MMSSQRRGIGLELRRLERFDFIADENGDAHRMRPLLFDRPHPSHCQTRECFDYHRCMKTGPDIALVASLVGDPARANMLTALMSGRALTAGELAREAGVTQQTASSHLGKLQEGGLVARREAGAAPLLPAERARRCGGARRARGSRRAGRPFAGAHRAERPRATPRARLLRPSCRRVGGAHVR